MNLVEKCEKIGKKEMRLNMNDEDEDMLVSMLFTVLALSTALFVMVGVVLILWSVFG